MSQEITHRLGLSLASWPLPSWATSRLVDEGSIEHRTNVGVVSPEAPERPIEVDVVQRDELDEGAASITRSPAEVSLGGIRLDPARARDLARLLLAAAEIVDSEEG